MQHPKLHVEPESAADTGRLLQLPLFVSGVFFVAGAAIMAGAVDVAMLVVGRILLGFGVGIASLVVPMLNAEYAPPKVRCSPRLLPAPSAQMSARPLC